MICDNVQFEDKDFSHQYVDKRPVPATFAVPPAARATEQCDREKVTSVSVNNNSAGYRYTNHDRINAQSAAATLSAVDQVSSVKSSAQFAGETQRLPSVSMDTTVNQPPLRRIKTESGTLSMSAKQYFQRKERERLERDAVNTELKLVKESANNEQRPSKSSPSYVKLVSNADKVESDTVKEEQQNKKSGSEFVRKTAASNDGLSKQYSTDLETGPNNTVSSGQSMSVRGQLQNVPSSTNRGLGMGDPSDQRPANIFESFHVRDSQRADGCLESNTVVSPQIGTSSHKIDEVTATSAADNLDLGAILKPEHVHGGNYSLELPVFTTVVTGASSVGRTAVQSGSSSLSVRRTGHSGDVSSVPSDRVCTGHSGDVSSVPSDRAQPRLHAQHSRERRRSTRHEGSMSVMPSTKHLRDQKGASGVKKYEHEMSRRRRPSNSSEPSPLKVKLSLLPGASRADCPVKQAGDTSASMKVKSHVSSPILESQTPSVPDSQEHIRLKLNVSSGRVEKVGNASPNLLSGMKLVLSKDKVSGEYQHGTSGSESGHHHHHHRHHHRRHHRHSRPDAVSQSAHVTVSRKRAADSNSNAKPVVEEKKRHSQLSGSDHQSTATGRFSQLQQSQASNVAINSGLLRTHIPSTYRVSGMSSAVPMPMPSPLPLHPPLPSEEPTAPPPPPLPPQ